MSAFYYSREYGPEGQILTGDGAPPGKPLDKLLLRERPPLKAAIEIGAALSDILCIARDDRQIHGDIDPASVRVDERGAVHLEGFGVPRTVTMAPEGRTDQFPVDIYGLGRVMYALLSPSSMGRLPADPDVHDDQVVDRVLEMDFSSVQGRGWVDSVRKFLCNILAWTPSSRPEPLDAANVLGSVAAQSPGESLDEWARRVHSVASPRVLSPTSLPEPEALGGPMQIGAPLRTGAVRKAPASKGESTSFWTP